MFKGILDLCGARGDQNEWKRSTPTVSSPTPAWRELCPVGKAVGSNLLLWEKAGRVVGKEKGKCD